MKKINNSGFVLAETLVVAVFLLVIFGMLYGNFYPLIGEYEKRETYDDVDSKYAIYWLKKMAEDSDYVRNANNTYTYQNYKFWRFECDGMEFSDEKREMCKTLVKNFEVAGCDKNGNSCDIFITDYNLVAFKEKVDAKVRSWQEDCNASEADCRNRFMTKCTNNLNNGGTEEAREARCQGKVNKSVFGAGLQDYIVYLPDYTTPSLNHADYRIIARFIHKKDNNNYSSYATIEVNR